MDNCNCGCTTPINCTCGCHEHQHTNCNNVPVGQISGELIPSLNQIALIQNGNVIGRIPYVSATGNLDILDAFGDPIPNI